jgi:Rrf2 family transcriptional regulator, iron-sulfur cluster assembly transcription factor
VFSQTTEYAIRAAIDIATRPQGEQVLASYLGETLDIPAHYLSKILQQLVRVRVLKSTRGRQGGFALAKPAEKIKLREIVAPFEDLKKYEECILGQAVCSDAGACPLHDFWAGVRSRYLEELNHRTLKELGDFQLRRLATMSAGLRGKLQTVPGMDVFKGGKA